MGKKEAEAEDSSLKEVLHSLVEEPREEFKTKILDSARNLRRHIRIYINGEDIRFLRKLNTPLDDGDEVLILPAIVGG